MRAFTEIRGDPVYVNMSKMNLRTVTKGFTVVLTIPNCLHGLVGCLESNVLWYSEKRVSWINIESGWS